MNFLTIFAIRVFWSLCCIYFCAANVNGSMDNTSLTASCVSDNIQKEIHANCEVEGNGTITLAQLMTNLTFNASGTKTASLNILCRNYSLIMLTKPVKLPSIFKHLQMDNCLVSFDYAKPESQNSLKTEIYRNVTFVVKLSHSVNNVIHSAKQGLNLPCEISESLLRYEMSRSKIEILDDLHDGTDFQQFHIAYANLTANRRKCEYPNLEYLRMADKRNGSNEEVMFNFVDDIFKHGRFPTLKEIHLDNAGLEKLPTSLCDRDWWTKFPKLSLVNARGNKLNAIPYHGDRPNHSIRVDLRENEINRLSKEDINLIRTVYPLKIDISNNTFDCSCTTEIGRTIELLKGIPTDRKTSTSYLRDVRCFTPLRFRHRKISSLSVDIICKHNRNERQHRTVIAICFSLVTVFLLCCFIICVRHRKSIVKLTQGKYNFVVKHHSSNASASPKSLHCCNASNDSSLLLKQFDAFVSYSHQHEEWVSKILCDKLENNPPYLKLCLHHREFVPGSYISDNIVDSIEQSRHTLLLLSSNFLLSEWCILEFRLAFQQTLKERQRHLVIVLMEDMQISELDPDMQHFLRTHTYLSKDDKCFWIKLTQALSV